MIKRNSFKLNPIAFMSIGSLSSSSAASHNTYKYREKGVLNNFFNKDVFLNSLKQIKKHANVSLNSLTISQKKLLDNISLTIKTFQDDEEISKIIKDSINNAFKEIEIIQPNTVVGFFIGCDQSSTDFPANKQCDPRCASSISSSENQKCGDSVIIFNGKEFEFINDKRSSHVYLYVENDKNNFRKEHLEFLKKNECKNVTLIIGDKQGNYKKLEGPIEIDNLQLNVSPSTSNTQTNAMTILIIFIIIVLVIAMISVIYMNRN